MKADTRLFKKISPYVSGKILDVGCGDGDFSEYVDDYTGIDIDGNGTRVNVEHDSFPFSSNSFDSVIALEVLEHLLDYRHCMKEIRRVLKPGGVFVASVPNVFAPFKVKRELLGQHYEDMNHVVSFNRYSLSHLLSSCGFSVEIVKPVVWRRYLMAVSRNNGGIQ